MVYNFVGGLQGLIALVFGLGAVVLAVFGLVDALRNRPDAFTAAGKRTKNFWLAVLGVAVALSFYSMLSPFSLPWIVAVVGAGVYAADVRPALRRVMGRGSSNNGPYGR
ncbi:MAG TPA: DUF2516 family protein [Dermatophilaceae bacterium]